MTHDMLKDLLDRAATAQDVDAALLQESSDALAAAFPDAAVRPVPPAGTVEGVLEVAHACVPGWSIHLRGRATRPDGHWHAIMRENEARDSDEAIGQGNAPTAALALLTALLSLAVQKTA